MIHFLCGELNKKLSENFFKYLFSNCTATTNKLNGDILVNTFIGFQELVFETNTIAKLKT